MPTPFGTSYGFEGDDQFKVGSTLVGATVSMFIDNAPTLYRDYVGRSQGTTSLNRFWLDRGDTIDPAWQISAQQQLCTPSARSAPLVPASPDAAGSLSAPSIVEPVCAGAKWVDVDTTMAGAFTTVEKGVNILNLSSSTGRVRMQIPGSASLGLNDTIMARHMLKSGVASLPDSATVVNIGSSFEILGGASYNDQESGALLEPAFVRETSPGPIFELRECCDVPRADDVLEFEITAADDPSLVITQVEMLKQQDGYYKGQWNWFAQVGQGGFLPDPGIVYEARMTESCVSPAPVVQFVVVMGQADPNDMSAPLSQLTVEVAGDTLSQNGPGSDALSVRPGHDLKITYGARDNLGVERIDLSVVGDLTSTDSESYPEQIPLPVSIEDNHTPPGALLPGESVTISTTAQDYSGNTSGAATITVTADSAAPVITSISPNPTFKYDVNGKPNSFDIQGEELYFPGTTTDVIFKSVTGTQLGIIPNQTGQSDELEDIPFLSQGVEQQVNVVVRVGGVESEPFLLKLSDRQGPFTTYTKGDFIPVKKTVPCSNNTSDPYAIHEMVISEPTTNGVNVNVYLNGDTSKSIRIADGVFGPGALLDTTSCKTVATWGSIGGTNTMNFYYMKDSKRPPFAQISNFGPENESVGISYDGTLGVITSYNTTSGLANGVDILEKQSLFGGIFTSCFNSCNFTYELEYGRRVVVTESGNEEASGVVQ